MHRTVDYSRNLSFPLLFHSIMALWWSQSWMVSRLTIDSYRYRPEFKYSSMYDSRHVPCAFCSHKNLSIADFEENMDAICYPLRLWKQVFITTVSCLSKLLARLSVTLPTNVWNQNSTIILSTVVVLIVHVHVVELLECYLYVILLVPWSAVRSGSGFADSILVQSRIRRARTIIRIKEM